jgi:hypothetical protein
VSRKPDGHGGWLYKYPGEAGYSAGKGDHEGHTRSLPGEHLDPHHEGYRPSIEKHPDGGHTLHTGEGISSRFGSNMGLDDHKAQWDHHKAAHDKALEAGNHGAAKAHEHALRAHAQEHNTKQERMRGQGANGGQPQPQEQEPPPPEEPQMREAQPTGESAALQGGRTRHTEQHPDVQAIQQALSNATKVMSDMVASHAHVQELQGRIKAVKKDKSLPKAMRKRLIAQHEAEVAAAKADQASTATAQQASSDSEGADEDLRPGQGRAARQGDEGSNG